MAGNSADPGRSVTSKVVSILLTFSDSDAQTLTEIARLAGLPVSTAYRLVNELAAWGVLERTLDAQYRIGTPLKALGSTAPVGPSLMERARRVMEDLAAATRTDVRLGVLQGTHVTYTERLCGSRGATRFWSGRTAPAHATAMGKALLAFSPPATVDAVIAEGLERYTPYTLTAPDQLRRTLTVTRLTRVALSRWELELGSCAIAVPVFGGGGAVVAGLELKVRDLRNDLRALQPSLLVAARGLSRELATGQQGGQSLVPGPKPDRGGAPSTGEVPSEVRAS